MGLVPDASKLTACRTQRGNPRQRKEQIPINLLTNRYGICKSGALNPVSDMIGEAFDEGGSEVNWREIAGRAK